MPRSATSKRRLSKNQRIEIRARIDLFRGLERAAQPPRFAQLARMPPRALPQRARARIARAVDTASRWRPFAIGAAPLAHARGNASRTQPVALPAHQARCRIALRTAVHVASGANVTGRLRTTAAKKIWRYRKVGAVHPAGAATGRSRLFAAAVGTADSAGRRFFDRAGTKSSGATIYSKSGTWLDRAVTSPDVHQSRPLSA